MAAGGPRCGSDCGIVLTPAQVIMDCYPACQSARSRLLRQLLLLVTNPSLQKASYSKHHVASAREMRLAGHSLPRGSPKKKKNPEWFQQEQALTGIRQQTPVPPRNDLWQQDRGKEQDATAKGRRAVCSDEGKAAPRQYGGSEKPGIIRGKIYRMRGCAI